jgi:hypothetical protein
MPVPVLKEIRRPALELLAERNIGVSTSRTISIKRIDSDYFEDSKNRVDRRGVR